MDIQSGTPADEIAIGWGPHNSSFTMVYDTYIHSSLCL